MLKHGRAGVPMEVMGLMLGEFIDDYTATGRRDLDIGWKWVTKRIAVLPIVAGCLRECFMVFQVPKIELLTNNRCRSFRNQIQLLKDGQKL